jgi:hypothetical protein
MKQDETLCLSVDHVRYPAETVEHANWFIFVGTRSDGSEVPCKGNMAWRPRPKERLKLTGIWTTYQGKREFSFKQAALDLPTDSRGLLHYVCELASGVGQALEIQIWEKRGEDWTNIREGEIPRLNGRVYDNLIRAIERAEGDRAKGAAIAELLKAGCSINMANAAYELWGSDTLGVVMSNPYRLAELPNYGFTNVDGDIRVYYGIGDSDERRIRSAVVYVLRQITSNGSTLVPWDVLQSTCISKLGGYQNLVVQAVKDMFSEGTLRGFKTSRSIALASDYKNESTIWEFISQEAI